MGEDAEKEIVQTERDIASFYNGAKIFIPVLISLGITGYGWWKTAEKAATDKGISDQRLNQLEITVAKLETKLENLEDEVNDHDVALGRIEVKVTNVEKVSNETYLLLYDFTRQR